MFATIGNKMYDQLFLQHSSLLTLAFAIIIFLSEWQRRRRKQSLPLPPGPIGYPIIGCLPAMLKSKPTVRWMHRLMNEMKTEIACFCLGSSHVITVTSPELACEFLKKHDAIFASRPEVSSARLINNGYISTILSPYGEQWKKMRKVHVTEVLSSAMHKQLHDKRCTVADDLVRYVYSQCQNPISNGLVDVRSIAQHYCCSVIKKLVFRKRFLGTMPEGPGMEDNEHMKATFRILSYSYGFAIADLFPWLEVFDFDGHQKVMRDAVDTLRKYQDPEINKRVEMWQKGIITTEEDILDVLINLKDAENKPLLTIHEIKAHVTDLMLAAIDNPSNAAEWSLAEMINQPNIFNKARQELDRVVGRDRLVQESDLPELNYIKACAKESFRLHPIAPFNLPHVSTKDVIVGGYHIPEGSQVLISRHGLGRNSRVWEEPLKYKPERHIAGDQDIELVDHGLNMLSFSTGRRGCPGIMLGTTLTTMLLARLIQGFYWKVPPNGPGTVDLIEAEDGSMMQKPLVAHATPKLKPHVYQPLQL